MPSYAGYQNIWCGGSDNILSPNLDLSWTETGVAIVVSLNDNELVFESSACTFQGARTHFFVYLLFWLIVFSYLNRSHDCIFISCSCFLVGNYCLQHVL